MANQSDDTRKPKSPELAHANYHEWHAAVCDELYAIDAEALFEKAAPTDTGVEQAGNVHVDIVDLATR